MKPPDEIDRIMAEALERELRAQGVSLKPEGHGWFEVDGTLQLPDFAQDVRAALKAAGLAIVLDEAQLLEKGAGVKLKP